MNDLETAISELRATVAASNAIVDHLLQRLTTACDLLGECAEFLQDQADVADGSYGVPAPNKAMELVSAIEELIGK